MPKFGLGLGLGPRNNKQFLSFDEKNRIIYDGGIVRNQKMLEDTLKFFNILMPNTKLLYCPELGVKLRTSGIYNYVAKLYDVGPTLNDATQTTALNQPYLSGNIAPNEKHKLKFLLGESGLKQITSQSTSNFMSSGMWTLTIVLSLNSINNSGSLLYFGSNARLEIHPITIRLRGKTGLSLYETNHSISGFKLGKMNIITFTYDNGKTGLIINGTKLQEQSWLEEFEFYRIALNQTSYNFDGSLELAHILDVKLTDTQIYDEHNYLRSIFPEIESVQIGAQKWATSNCEIISTPQGNLIQEMQAAANVEKITNAADREFTSDTKFWFKLGNVTISDGAVHFTNAPQNSTLSKSLLLKDKVFYKVSYSITNYVSGSIQIQVGGAFFGINRNSNGNYTEYVKSSGTGIYIINKADNTTLDLENISVQEVGWSDSTSLYNYVYADTSGTAEQKEYAAVKAAAMWCYYNNDPAIGAVYGKLYNWYAARLLQLDIDYYNAANPTTPWGWRVPTSADFTTLSTYLGGDAVAGGKMKKEGLDYWNTPNTGADNSSGFSVIGGGYRASVAYNCVFAELKSRPIIWTANAYGYSILNASASLSVPIIGGSKEMGNSLRLIKA